MLHAPSPANKLSGARGLLVAGALVFGGVTPVLNASPACASSGHAALVVDTGERVLDMCVSLPEPEVTGIELIELAGEQFGLEYSLGFGGEAVCMLAGVGPGGDDCWRDYPYFWGYWHGGEAGWTWSGTGAGANTITEGEIEGWSWGAGQDPNSHPPPPPRVFTDVCAAIEEPEEEEAEVDEVPAPANTPVAELTPSAPPKAEPEPERDRPRRRETEPPSSPAPEQEVASPRESEPGSDGGSPVRAVAVGASAGLFVAGALVARRRRKEY